MLLPPLEVDLDAYEEQLAKALLESSTHIFIDTSVMIWLYGLGDSARNDFIAWIRNPKFSGRVSVPVWALHEFLGKVKDGATSVFFPFDGQIKELVASRERIMAVASLLIDDPWLKRNGNTRGRDFYLRRLDRIFNLLGKTVSPLRTNLSAEAVHNELFPFFNEIALKSNIFAELPKIQSEFDARCEGRIPPGYEDRRKRGADVSEDEKQSKSGANRFGDLVFWKEVIGECKAQQSQTAIIISNDVKKDWVYQPPRYLDLDGRSRSNNQKNSLKRVYLASPFLAHEIQQSAGVNALFVVNIYQLLPVLQLRNKLSLDALARATQIDFEARSAIGEASSSEGDLPGGSIGEFTLEATAETPPLPERVSPQPQSSNVAIEGKAISGQALADKNYSGGSDKETDRIIADLKSHNWYVQNPAVKAARARLVANLAEADQVFVLGRNIYQAACGGANEAIVFVQKLWAEIVPFDSTCANLLVGGMLFEAYFDSSGKIRSRPKSDHLRFLLALQRNTNLRPAVEFIHERLTPYRTKFLLIPSPDVSIKELSIVTEKVGEENILRSISDDQSELTIATSTESSRPIVKMLGENTTLERLLEVTAEYFCVLVEQLETKEPETAQLQIADRLSFVNWGTDSDFDFS